ncbi:MAG: glycerol-3-phosphate dehydrogenase/oxidase, partial [Planctomycetota bacterium]
MNRNPSALDRERFDLVVIGGGVFGACAAWDASMRGLRVALLDRAGFCSATSAQSYKLIHGGLRYLQHADLARVRQSSLARRTWLRIAPHLARPLPIVVPTYGHGKRGKALMRTAMAVYDAATFDRNRGIADPVRRVPRGICLGRAEVLARYPGVPRRGLTGAAVFCDGQMYNPTRLVIEIVRAATDAGCVAANHVEVIGFRRDGDRVTGVTARDALDGAELEIEAGAVLNAAGPYAEPLLARGLGRGLAPPTCWSRDAYFVVNRPLVSGDEALALPAATRDPEAVLSRGARHLFLVPWRGSTLVGVWHRVHAGDPDGFAVDRDELTAWLDEINAACGGLDLTLDDVAHVNAGLIPFGENDPASRDLKFGHRSRIVDHARTDGVRGLVTLVGVRYTTGPVEAARAVEVAARQLGTRLPPSAVDRTPLPGGRIDDFEGLVRRVTDERPAAVDADVVRPLVHNHGSAVADVLALV